MLVLNQLIGFGVGGLISTGVIESNPSTPSGTNDFTTGNTFFDRNWTVNNGQTVFKIGFLDNSGGGTVTLKIAERTGAGNYNIVVSQSFVHGGSGWEDVSLDVPYPVPASGTFYAGVFLAIVSDNLAANPRSFKNTDLGLGAQTGFTEDSGNTPAVRVTY